MLLLLCLAGPLGRWGRAVGSGRTTPDGYILNLTLSHLLPRRATLEKQQRKHLSSRAPLTCLAGGQRGGVDGAKRTG